MQLTVPHQKPIVAGYRSPTNQDNSLTAAMDSCVKSRQTVSIPRCGDLLETDRLSTALQRLQKDRNQEPQW